MAKRSFETHLAESGILPSEHTDDEQVGESRHCLHVVSTSSPLLDALLEGREVPLGDGSRASKLQRMEKLVQLQVSRLEDVIRSYQQSGNAATLQSHSVRVGHASSVDSIAAVQRDVSCVDCRTRGCPLEAIVGVGYCLDHAAESNRYPFFSACPTCGKTMLASMTFCGLHAPTVGPPPL